MGEVLLRRIVILAEREKGTKGKRSLARSSQEQSGDALAVAYNFTTLHSIVDIEMCHRM